MTPSKLTAINKLLTPYLEFLENKKRVNKFEELEELTTILNDVTLDYKELLKQVKQTINTGTVEPVITPETKKSDSDTEESASESEESEESEREIVAENNLENFVMEVNGDKSSKIYYTSFENYLQKKQGDNYIPSQVNTSEELEVKDVVPIVAPRPITSLPPELPLRFDTAVTG